MACQDARGRACTRTCNPVCDRIRQSPTDGDGNPVEGALYEVHCPAPTASDGLGGCPACITKCKTSNGTLITDCILPTPTCTWLCKVDAGCGPNCLPACGTVTTRAGTAPSMWKTIMLTAMLLLLLLLLLLRVRRRQTGWAATTTPL